MLLEQTMKAAGLLLASLACSAVLAQPAPPQLPKRFPWDHRPNKCFLPRDDGGPPGPMCEARDWPSFGETRRHIDMLLGLQEFGLLERAEREVGFSRERFPTGEYLFEAWFLSLDSFFDAWGQRGKAVAVAWSKEKGRGGYAPLAEAMAAHAEAWAARGRGYANTITPEAWALYYAKLDEADALLETASPKLRAMGPWYSVKLRLAFEMRQPQSAAIHVLKEGAKAWPDYLSLYGTGMYYVSPKWGGSFERMDAMARFALENNRDTQGAAVYAAAYERFLRYNPDARYTLKDMAVDWDLMKRGFREIEARGETVLSKNFAGLACQMRDREEARRLYVLYEKRTPDVKPDPTDACRVFAMSL